MENSKYFGHMGDCALNDDGPCTCGTEEELADIARQEEFGDTTRQEEFGLTTEDYE